MSVGVTVTRRTTATGAARLSRRTGTGIATSIAAIATNGTATTGGSAPAGIS
jgi:hypothetical protein